MIPSILSLLQAASWVERRYGFVEGPSHRTIFDCYWAADGLNPTEHDEPAALFFVFCSEEQRLGRVWRVLPKILAQNQARSLGLQLVATEEDLDALRDAVADGKATYEEVRAWFAERIGP